MGIFKRIATKVRAKRTGRRRLSIERLENRRLLALDLAVIAGRTFLDSDANGFDPGDTPVLGATIELYRDTGNGLFSAVTDIQIASVTSDPVTGEFSFAGPEAGGTLPANSLTNGIYFLRQLPAPGLVPPAVQQVIITQADRDGETLQTIDNFDLTEQVLTADPITTSETGSVVAPEAIGGRRDVVVNHISGAGEVSVRIDRFDSNLLAFVSDNNVVGQSLIQYDSTAGLVLNPTGLGGVDLSDGNPLAGIVIANRGDQVGGTAQVRLYSSATAFSTASIAIPNIPALDDFFFPFTPAVFVPSGGGADFENIGAIEITIQGVSDLDATVNVVRSVAPAVQSFNLANLQPRIQIEKSTNGQDADVPTGPIVGVGQTATFTYAVTSTGGTSLQGIAITDDDGTPADLTDDFNPTFTGGDTNSNSLLDPGETWTYQAVRTVTAGQYVNIAVVTATDVISLTPVTDNDASHHLGANPGIQIEKSTNGQDADTGTGPLLGVGTTATFTYVVTNTGNTPLGNVVVRDDNGTPGNPADDLTPTLTSGDANGNGRLDLGETWTYTATRTVTAGQYTNIGSVSANPVDAAGADLVDVADVDDTDPSNHFGVIAAIQIEKSTNGQDADTGTGPLLAVGTTATFTFVVINTGNTPLGSVVVRDDNGTPGNLADDLTPTLTSGDTNSNGRLDLGETWTYTATRTVTAGQYTNIGSVTANPVDSQGLDIAGIADVNDNDPSNHFGVAAGIQIEKSTNGQDADTGTGPLLAVGSTATFTFVVTNTGNTPLGNVVIRDDNGTPLNLADDFTPTGPTGDANSNGRLDLGETWTYTATRTVTAGQYTNIGSVTANPVDAAGADIAGVADVNDTDPSNHFGVTAGIQIEKSTNGQDADTGTGPLLAVGSTATFTFVVTGIGNTPLGSVVVRDDNGTPGNPADDLTPTLTSGDANSNGRLDLGETWTYTATRTVTAGQYTNIGSVTANPVDAAGADIAGVADVNDTDPSNHFGVTAGIQIEKSTNGQDADVAPGPSLLIGSTATFTYVVTGTGNTPLGNVVVRDDNGTPGNPADDLTPTLTSGDTNSNGRLDLGETWTYTATRTVTAGQYTNIGSVTANPVDATGADIAGVADVNDTDPSNHLGFSAVIGLQKLTNGIDTGVGPGPDLPIGSTATFTYILTNLGTVPVSNIVLQDDNGTPANPADDLTPVLDSGDTNSNNQLDVGETWSYRATRIVTLGAYSNVARAEGQSPTGTAVIQTDTSAHRGVERLSKRRFLASRA